MRACINSTGTLSLPISRNNLSTPFIASAVETGSFRSPRAISTTSGNAPGLGCLRVKARTPAPRFSDRWGFSSSVGDIKTMHVELNCDHRSCAVERSTSQRGRSVAVPANKRQSHLLSIFVSATRYSRSAGSAASCSSSGEKPPNAKSM